MRMLGIAACLALAAGAASAEPTRVTVRAHSLDAKFIGDQMGGVAVTLRDARTGKVLARGVTQGGTGDTQRIMKTPQVRGQAITDAATAGFEAVLDIDRPTLVEAEGIGPAGKPASAVRVTSQMWVLPGRHLASDGWVLTFPGLVIEPEVAGLRADGAMLKAKVSLMCGCPIEPGGLWAAENYTVTAELLQGGRTVSLTPLAYGGTPSQFAVRLPAAKPGRYRLRLTATDRTTPNAGVWEAPVRLR